MACDFERAPEIATDYLLGRLPEQERDAFEAHLFECDRCLAAVQAVERMRDELARPPAAAESSLASWTWMLGAAAVVTLGVAGLVWSGAGHHPAAPAAPAVASTTAPPASTPRHPSPEALMALATVDPPQFVPLTVRGASSRFDRAMQAYAAHDYASAAEGLTPVAAARPGDPQVQFFLGVSRLMTGDAAGALVPLRKTVELGASAYQQSASFFAAKALIREGDLTGAKAELARTARLPGDLAGNAAALSRQLDAVAGR